MGNCDGCAPSAQQCHGIHMTSRRSHVAAVPEIAETVSHFTGTRAQWEPCLECCTFSHPSLVVHRRLAYTETFNHAIAVKRVSTHRSLSQSMYIAMSATLMKVQMAMGAVRSHS